MYLEDMMARKIITKLQSLTWQPNDGACLNLKMRPTVEMVIQKHSLTDIEFLLLGVGLGKAHWLQTISTFSILKPKNGPVMLLRETHQVLATCIQLTQLIEKYMFLEEETGKTI